MTKCIDYRCNLCGVRFDDPDCITGIYFKTVGMKFTHANEAENHICNECLKQLRESNEH